MSGMCDAQGFYSGFGEPGEQKPDEPYRFRPGPNDLNNNTRFCRGIGISDANGVVSFRSIFPGWYNGRDLHIHVMALKRGSAPRDRLNYRGGDHLFTTQLYFQPALIDRVHKASEPYLRRTKLPAYLGCIQGDERGNSGLRIKADSQWQPGNGADAAAAGPGTKPSGHQPKSKSMFSGTWTRRRPW